MLLICILQRFYTIGAKAIVTGWMLLWWPRSSRSSVSSTCWRQAKGLASLAWTFVVLKCRESWEKWSPERQCKEYDKALEAQTRYRWEELAVSAITRFAFAFPAVPPDIIMYSKLYDPRVCLLLNEATAQSWTQFVLLRKRFKKGDVISVNPNETSFVSRGLDTRPMMTKFHAHQVDLSLNHVFYFKTFIISLVHRQDEFGLFVY